MQMSDLLSGTNAVRQTTALNPAKTPGMLLRLIRALLGLAFGGVELTKIP